MSAASEIIAHYADRNIRLSIAQSGRLAVDAPAGELSDQDVAYLQAVRDEILTELATRGWKTVNTELNQIIGQRIVPESEWSAYFRLMDAAGDAARDGDDWWMESCLEATLDWARGWVSAEGGSLTAGTRENMTLWVGAGAEKNS